MRRNDSAWRAAVLDMYGEWCLACGRYGAVEIDHIIPRSQGGRSDRENGAPLCRDCHYAKTCGTLQYEPEWLLWPTIEYLADNGWVAWDADGEPYGRGLRHFTAWKATPPDLPELVRHPAEAGR